MKRYKMKRYKIITYVTWLSVLIFIAAAPCAALPGDDEAAVRRVVMDSFVPVILEKGDARMIKKGFHPDFSYLARYGEELVMSRFFPKAKKDGEEDPYEPKPSIGILSINVTGFAATAIVNIKAFGFLSQTFHLSLYKFKDGWRVVRGIVQLSPYYTPPEKRKLMRLPDRLLDEYAGTFSLGGGKEINITRKDGGLWVEIPGKGGMAFLAESRMQFFAKEKDYTVRFLHQKGEKITRLELIEGKAVKGVVAMRMQPSVNTYSYKKPGLELELKKVVGGPFNTEEKAAAFCKGRTTGTVLILKSSPMNSAAGYYVVEGKPVITTVDLEDIYKDRGQFKELNIGIKLKPEAAKRMRAFTAKHIGQRLAFILGNQVVMAPIIRSQLGKAMMITGNFTEKDINEIIARLKPGMKNQSKLP